MRYILIPVLMLLIASCGGGEAGPSGNVQMKRPKGDINHPTNTPLAENRGYVPEKYSRLNPELIPHLQFLDSVYSAAPYYYRYVDDLDEDYDGSFMFYVVDGVGPGRFSNKSKTDDSKMGIVIYNTHDIKVLLPVEYDKIFSPDGTAESYIEIEKNGKYGLVNYWNGQVIKAEYDLIFPPADTNYIAIGKIGIDFFGINDDGSRIRIYEDEFPKYMELLKVGKKVFDMEDNRWTLMKNSYVELDSYDNTHYTQALGVIFTPSYLLPTGMVREVIEYVPTSEPYYMATTENIVEVRDAHVNTWDVGIVYSKFIESGVDARDYVAEERRLTTILTDKNQIVETATIYENNIKTLATNCRMEPRFLFVNDTLWEVVYSNYHYPPLLAYSVTPQYDYYSISRDGKITKQDLPRMFDCTHFVNMNLTYFKGCFLEISAEWKPFWEDMYNGRESHHLTADDLDIMRNEIYAEYGYKFKTAKWDSFFRLQPWYKPRFDNVDDKLTELEKANIKLILEVKDKLLQDPEKYLKTEYTNVSAAG